MRFYVLEKYYDDGRSTVRLLKDSEVRTKYKNGNYYWHGKQYDVHVTGFNTIEDALAFIVKTEKDKA